MIHTKAESNKFHAISLANQELVPNICQNSQVGIKVAPQNSKQYLVKRTLAGFRIRYKVFQSAFIV